MKKKILIACEYSGIVRDAFTALGYDAVSCDILPSESHGIHYQGDVRELLSHPWAAVIAFPPCTHLASSGALHFAKKRADGRQQQAISFFMRFTKLKCPYVIENPVGIMSTVWRKPDQIINPFQFGDSVSKRTCLWVYNLPLLEPTSMVEGSVYVQAPSGRRYPQWQWKTGGGCGKKRSQFFPGIAQAMASQWGPLI